MIEIYLYIKQIVGFVVVFWIRVPFDIPGQTHYVPQADFDLSESSCFTHLSIEWQAQDTIPGLAYRF